MSDLSHTFSARFQIAVQTNQCVRQTLACSGKRHRLIQEYAGTRGGPNTNIETRGRGAPYTMFRISQAVRWLCENSLLRVHILQLKKMHSNINANSSWPGTQPQPGLTTVLNLTRATSFCVMKPYTAIGLNDRPSPPASASFLFPYSQLFRNLSHFIKPNTFYPQIFSVNSHK